MNAFTNNRFLLKSMYGAVLDKARQPKFSPNVIHVSINN